MFASSGARWWRSRKPHELLDALALVDACLRTVAIYRPEWWSLENPEGRLRRWLGPPLMTFNPCDFGDAYTKRTLLWGSFRPPRKRAVKPRYIIGKVDGKKYSPIHYYGRRADRQNFRSKTPLGFARAFFEANP